jgi:NAD-dependent deacetylase
VNLPEARRSLKAASSVAVLTGAGISAPSGIPTFREAQTGLWARFSPEDLASPSAYARDAKLVWDWYAWRYRLCAQALPNRAHALLVELEHRLSDGFLLVTQNVDGLHERAGSRQLVELHGNIARARCVRCRSRQALPPPEDFIPPPTCAKCGSRMRPDVVWFSETLPPDALEAAWNAFERCQVALIIGTSGVVEPAASLGRVAKAHGAVLIEVNPTETPLSGLADWCVRAGAIEGLDALMGQGSEVRGQG